MHAIRERVPMLTADRPLYLELAALRELCDEGALVTAARKHIALS